MPMEEVILRLLVWALTAVAGWAVGRVTSTAKANKQERKALYVGVRALLRREIVDAYESYIVRNEPMSVERYTEMRGIYDAYIGLNGNGTGKRMWREIEQKHIWIVGNGEGEKK